MEKVELIAVRAYNPPQDKSFIMASWLKGLRYGNSWFELIPQDIYFKRYHAVIEHLLSMEGTIVRVACLREDPEVILGYSVSGNKDNTLHWVFVKKAWRAIGIAKMLCPDTLTQVSHVTKIGVGILNKHPKLTFNPFL